MIARPRCVVSSVAGVAFVALLVLVIVDWTPLRRWDAVADRALRGYGTRHGGVIAVARVVTEVASTGVFLTAGAVAAVTFAVMGQRRTAICCALVTAVVSASWGLMHWLVPHPRPEDPFVATITSDGFPSGHAANAITAALVAVTLVWRRLAAAGRVVVTVAAVAFVTLIGLSRVVLLAHWPSDVVGAWLLALAVVPPLMLWRDRQPRLSCARGGRPRHRCPFLPRRGT